MRSKEIQFDNLTEQNLLYAEQAKSLRSAVAAKTRSASISESKAAFYKDAYEAEALAHQQANEDVRSMSSTDLERALYIAIGAAAVIFGGWALGQLTP